MENLKCCGSEAYKEGRNEESENEMNLYQEWKVEFRQDFGLALFH